jgi:sulfite reductase beta subunit-like hemoprotein
MPTCGLALTEAERVRDGIVAAIEARLRRYGLERERLSIRITGCPERLRSAYTGDIGIVGRMPGFYSLYVGGNFVGRDRRDARSAFRAVRFGPHRGRRRWRFLPSRIGLLAMQQVLAERHQGAA